MRPPALPKIFGASERQRVANSEWRLANNETANFLEGSVLALPIMLNNCTLRL
jgi:hypothetical protein